MGISPQMYLELFKPREDTFAKQSEDNTYVPIDKEFGPEYVDKHLSGEQTYGQYVVNPEDNKIKFAAIDNDIETDSEEPLSNALEAAKDERDRAINFGLKESQCWIEFSGRRGYHMWIFFENPIPAIKAKRFLEFVVDGTPEEKNKNGEKAGVTIEGGHYEVFPKQIVVEEGGYGNLIKTPLGYHQATGNRMVFVDDDGNERVNQGSVLSSILRNRICEETIDGILDRLGEAEDDMMERVEDEAKKRDLDKSDVVMDNYDLRPCVAKALSGEVDNLCGEEGHLMRLAAATELLANGFSRDEAVKFFEKFPGYDESITRKKLREIERKDHKPWRCSTLKRKCNRYSGDCPCPFQNNDAIDQIDMNRKQYGSEWGSEND